jgi:phosphoglucomutase
MPTSTAADRVALALGVPCFETPTGWKFFGNLLDAGRVTLCGEESYGTSSNHVREKDGIWAVLFWINILAATGLSVETLVRAHWAQFGRNFYTRHDYEGLDTAVAQKLITALCARLATLPGQVFEGRKVAQADDFAYTDPIDGSVSSQQGIRVLFEDGARIVWRLSGTGTQGATLRIYIESYEPKSERHDDSPQAVLAPLVQVARHISQVTEITGRTQPDVVN